MSCGLDFSKFPNMEQDINPRRRQNVLIGVFLWIGCLSILIWGGITAVREPSSPVSITCKLANSKVQFGYDWLSHHFRLTCVSILDFLTFAKTQALIFYGETLAFLRQEVPKWFESLVEEESEKEKNHENSSKTDNKAGDNVVAELALWFLNNLKARGIQNLNEMRKAEFLDFKELFEEDQRVEKFQLHISSTTSFIQEYYSQAGFSQADLNQLITAAKYVEKANLAQKFFNITARSGCKFSFYYIALLREGDTVFIATTITKFNLVLSNDDSFFSVAKKSLCEKDYSSLNDYLMYLALRHIHANLRIPVEILSDSDRYFFENL